MKSFVRCALPLFLGFFNAAASAQDATNALLTVHIVGPGILVPNYDGQMLQIGKKYSMKAQPAKGCGFAGFGIGNGPVRLTFTLNIVMQSNTTVTATFADITPPAAAITFPALNQRLTNSVTIAGRASDNMGVTSVQYQVNGGGYHGATLEAGTNGMTNWTGGASSVVAGTNTVDAYATDAQGSHSRVVSSKFFYVVTPGDEWASDSLNGLEGQFTLNGGPPVTASFDLSNFNQTGPSTDDFQVGNYSYTRVEGTTNLAELVLSPFNPQGAETRTLELTFTNHYSGTYTNPPARVTHSVTNEGQVLSSANPATLSQSNVVDRFSVDTNSIAVFDPLTHVSAETHILSSAVPATLDHKTAVTGSIVVFNEATQTIYTNGVNYSVSVSTNGFTQISWLTNSGVADNVTALVSYDWTTYYANGVDYSVFASNDFVQLLLATNSAIADGAPVLVSYNWTEFIHSTNSGAFSFEVANVFVPVSVTAGRTLYVTSTNGADQIKFLKNSRFMRTHPDKTKDSGTVNFHRIAPDAALLQLWDAKTNLLDEIELTFQAPRLGLAATYSYSYSGFFFYTYTPLGTNYGGFQIK